MEKAIEYMKKFREVHGIHLTVTHLVTKPVAEALERCPDANAILRFNKIYTSKGRDHLCARGSDGPRRRQGRPDGGEDRALREQVAQANR
jgi:hypothetical protein